MRDTTRHEDGALGRWRWPLACTLALTALIGFAQVAAASGPPFRVVINAGHGGKDPGAISPLLPLAEKDMALDVALRLGASLQRRGVQVMQTRTSDRDVALPERAATAGRVGAAALVSIPLNATANGSAVASGAEVAEGLAEGVIRFRDGRTQARPQLMLASMGGVSLGGGAASNLYFVRPGDTLRAIAAHLGVPDAALRLLDGGQPAASGERPLHVGQPLQIAPGSGGAAQLPPARMQVPVTSSVYVVSKGDTLTGIATRYRTSAKELARVNGLDDPDLIKVGQRLRLAPPTAGSAR